MSQPIILQFLALLIMLGLSVYSDIKERRIPNKLTVSGLFFGLLIGIPLEGGFPLEALSGAALAFLLAFAIHALGGFGAGDAKLLTAVGAYVGPGGVFSVFAYGALAGGLVAVINAIGRGAFLGVVVNTRNLVASWIKRSHPGDRMRPSFQGAHSLPYGVAIAAGAALAWMFPLALPGWL
jgi:prepilin peptidase CpaA